MKKYQALEVEKKFIEKWETEKTHSYDPSSSKESFVIDTPPPTVSGALHIGHVFSYTQTDILARFQRMQNKNVFYPMGWDDNGLPSEKRIQNLYGVSCDPSKAYEAELTFKPSKKERIKVSRKNFLELCDQQVLEDEKKYRNLWTHLALSVDWKQSYRTIDPSSQTISQKSFVELYKKNLIENRFAPVFWDTQFQTAISQADIEDREKEGFYHDIRFQVKDSDESFVISTTRPELLAACVAVVAHPDDKRFQHLFSKTATTPLFFAEVPILPSTHADPEKGTGILMVCTFGDAEDIRFWKKQKLPLKEILNKQGRLKDISFTEDVFKSLKPKDASKNYEQLAQLTVFQARKKIAELLKEQNYLVGDLKPSLQHIKYYEKGDKPLELLPTRQWFIKVLDHKDRFLKQADKIQWHPPHMKKRLEQWVEGLNEDWCVSRQRFFGVPLPLWYPINKEGEVLYTKPLLPETFPVDPLKETPKGYTEAQRNQKGGFVGDADVLDTWATSSLTPFINSSWQGEKHRKLFPADLRPQAHEIIRTWAFYTIVQALFHENQIPWKHVALSGWVVDPQKSKMSKSKGNTITPEKLIESHSADALRYWAGRVKLGQDSTYDENVFKIGKKLTTKIFNASQFVIMQTENLNITEEKNLDAVTEAIDQAWIAHMNQVHQTCTQALENFFYAQALELAEKTFWLFCDNYIELVKGRVYKLKDQAEGRSGALALDYSLYLFLKLFAPYIPYITEEVWSKKYTKENSSVHKSSWSKTLPLKESPPSYDSLLKTTFSILEQIRNAKSSKQKSLLTPCKKLEISGNQEISQFVNLTQEDLKRAGHVESIDLTQTNDSDAKCKLTF